MRITVGLKADHHKRRLYLPGLTHEALGRPSLAQVEYDAKALALRIVPPTNPGYAYRVTVNDSRASIHIALRRTRVILAVEMPEGRYEPIASNVFIHESRLDQRPEAKLARFMVPIADFKKFFYRNKYWRINFFPQDGTLFPRTRTGLLTWAYGLWYLVHHPEATYRDLEGYQLGRQVPPISHTVAVRMVQQLREFLPPQNPVFNWTPYHNYVKSQDLTYLRISPKRLSLTAKAWSLMGEPSRVNLSTDPVEGIITITPDPVGAHALNAKTQTDRTRSAMVATIAALEDTTPLGVYEPISLGRFEGVFKLTRRHKPITDWRPNPETWKFKPVIPDGAYDGWPSKRALAQRARRLRELSERLEEERAR